MTIFVSFNELMKFRAYDISRLDLRFFVYCWGMNPQFERAPLMLLELTQERSLEALWRTTRRLIAEFPNIVLFRIWLIEKGDICPQCPMRATCPDQTRCLHAVVNGGTSAEGSNIQNWLSRVPLGVGTIGKIAATGDPLLIRDLTAETLDILPSKDYLGDEVILGFDAYPIIFQDEVLGVVATLARTIVPDEGPVWQRLLAAHIASAIANARAFEEIQNLKAQLELENAYLQEEVVTAKAFGELIGQSSALKKIVSQIDVVAPTDATVLILGETGVGKELVAREIHKRSHRRNKPLIRVNCASIPRELYESEFFGHVKGAFTGAFKDRAGRFEMANGGSLFLDEIGEIPLELQGKLLRALQEKQYERVGDDKTRSVDVRIIAATNRDLKQEADAGRFRQDLFYRLNVFPIEVPSLRERREDLPLLIRHFVALSVQEFGCVAPRMTKASLDELEGYDWPGNIRELRNVVERAVILARGGPLRFDLPVTPQPVAQPLTPTVTVSSKGEILTEPERRNKDRENLLAALNQTHWKIAGPNGAAELLGLKPTTLISRIKKLQLKRNSGSQLT